MGKKSIFLSPTCYLSSCLNRSTTRLSRSSSMVLQHTRSAPACSSASSLVRSATHADHNDGKGASEGEILRTTRGRTSSCGRRGEGQARRCERKGAGYGDGKLGSCDGESSGRPQRWEGSSASKGKGAGAQPSYAVGVSLGSGKKATGGRKRTEAVRN
jgi:hypothetical protein